MRDLESFAIFVVVLGHTDNFCPKRVEPDFVEGEKGWGKFLNAGGRTIGGGITVNRWLRGGRTAGHEGRGEGRDNTNGRRGGHDDNPNNVVVMSQSREHALFGRVRVLRGGYFTFHRMVTNIIGHNGGGEGQWVSFELNETNIETQRTIRRLVNGIGAANGRTNTENTTANNNNDVSSNFSSQQPIIMMLEDAATEKTSADGVLRLTGCNQALGMPAINYGGFIHNKVSLGETSEVGRMVYARKKEKIIPSRPLMAGLLVIREGVHAVQNVQTEEVPKNDKGKGKLVDEPSVKKRTRSNVNSGALEDAGGVIVQENTQMIVDSVSDSAGSGSNFDSIQNNPLFSDNIVMAEAEVQPRQQPCKYLVGTVEV